MQFVDVDYPELIERKCSVIRETPQLRQLINPNLGLDRVETGSEIRLKSEQYLAIACDLQDLTRLESALWPEIDLTNSLILFTAEVSLTYMETPAADALISWTSQFDHGKS